MPQWMAGFCRTMREETNQNLKDHMLNYLIDLMNDAKDFSWVWPRPAMLLCRMEQGEVTGYDQVDRIDRIRRANAQKHVAQGSHNSNVSQFGKKSIAKVDLCLANFSIKVRVHIPIHMKLEALCINTYVLIALQCPTKLFHILKWIVGIRKKSIQKTTKSGHEPLWCSCP